MEKEQINRFKNLIQKYRSNHLSPEEFEEFVQMLSEGAMEEAELLDDVACQDWADSKKHLEDILRDQKMEWRRRSYIQWIWRSAAAILLLSMIWVFWPQSEPEDMVYTTGYGQIQNIKLPDGSVVLLNANSQISWSGDWRNLGYRRIKLTGEAYFDVKRQDEIPFEVLASGIRIDVLGTEFNVRDRGSETEVFLHEGKVDLRIGEEEAAIKMVPGDFVRYDSMVEKLIVEKDHELKKQAGWVDGMLNFENQTLDVILGEFKILYGIQFKIDNEDLKHKRMDLSLPYSDWELVKKALGIAIDAEFIEMKDSVYIK